MLLRTRAHQLLLRPSSARFLSRGPLKKPFDFGSRFQIEPYDFKLDLETFNVHPRDKRVVYDDNAHTYFFDGVKMASSVTTKVASYFEQFDADKVADLMINGQRWPREGYTHPDGSAFTKKEIIEKWDKIGQISRNKGSWLHHNIERHLNHLDTAPDLPEMDKFKKYEKDFLIDRQITSYRTEWPIIADKEGIGGTVDFVGRKADGTYVIMDWKTTADLEKKFDNQYKKYAKPPLDHVPDCDGQKYALQLNIYRYILEKYYGLKISEMRLVSFTYRDPKYFTTTVYDMSNDLELIFPSEEGDESDSEDDNEEEEEEKR